MLDELAEKLYIVEPQCVDRGRKDAKDDVQIISFSLGFMP